MSESQEQADQHGDEQARPEPLVDHARLADCWTDGAQAREIQRGYLQFFVGCGRVLDLGCGLGGFLKLLQANGVQAVGVDASRAAVDACRAAGLEARLGAASAVLGQLDQAGERFDGALLSHVIEHCQPDAVAALLAAAARVLNPGARMVVVTPNFSNLVVATEFFWLDPTHVRPYPRPLIAQLGVAAGFDVVSSFDDPASVPLRPPLRRALAWLRSLLSGADRSSPLDAVVVLERRA